MTDTRADFPPVRVSRLTGKPITWPGQGRRDRIALAEDLRRRAVYEEALAPRVAQLLDQARELMPAFRRRDLDRLAELIANELGARPPATEAAEDQPAARRRDPTRPRAVPMAPPVIDFRGGTVEITPLVNGFGRWGARIVVVAPRSVPSVPSAWRRRPLPFEGKAASESDIRALARAHADSWIDEQVAGLREGEG